MSGTVFNTAGVTKNLRLDSPGTSMESNIIVIKEIKVKNKRNSKMTLLYSDQSLAQPSSETLPPQQMGTDMTYRQSLCRR